MAEAESLGATRRLHAGALVHSGPCRSRLWLHTSVTALADGSWHTLLLRQVNSWSGVDALREGGRRQDGDPVFRRRPSPSDPHLSYWSRAKARLTLPAPVRSSARGWGAAVRLWNGPTDSRNGSSSLLGPLARHPAWSAAHAVSAAGQRSRFSQSNLKNQQKIKQSWFYRR